MQRRGAFRPSVGPSDRPWSIQGQRDFGGEKMSGAHYAVYRQATFCQGTNEETSRAKSVKNSGVPTAATGVHFHPLLWGRMDGW